MRHLTGLAVTGIIGALPAFGIRQGQSQPAGCGSDHVCVGDVSVAAASDPNQASGIAKSANLAARERCRAAPGWERAARLIGGSLMLIRGVVTRDVSPLALLLDGAGVATLVTVHIAATSLPINLDYAHGRKS